jgi:hypothetical protein
MSISFIMDFTKLTKNNYEMYIMKMYTNPQCSDIEEFNEDMNRIKYIKRLLGRYHIKGHLRERLVLNHIIILNNVFGSEACCRILFYNLSNIFHPYLKSFLNYLKYLPVSIPEIEIDNIPTDHKIDKMLENMK